jgi:hypothetical protein
MSKAKTCTTAKCKAKKAKAKKCPPVKQTVQDVKNKLVSKPRSHK